MFLEPTRHVSLTDKPARKRDRARRKYHNLITGAVMSARGKRAVKLTALVAAIVVPWLVLTGSDPKAVAAPDLTVSFTSGL